MIAKTGVKLVINGKECIPKDVNGNIKDIYVINGTTYVPVRAVSEELGLPITWSSKTNSVFIGKHKTEGLTVENIDSPEVIRDAVNKHFFKYELPYILGYFYEQNPYNVVDDNLEEYLLSVVCLNLDYISDETLLELVGHLDEETLKRYLFAQYQLVSFTFEHGHDWYDWNYVAVDPKVGDYLTKLVNTCVENVDNEDKSYVFTTYWERFYVDNDEYYKNLYSPYIDKFIDLMTRYVPDVTNAQKEVMDMLHSDKEKAKEVADNSPAVIEALRRCDKQFFERLNNAKKNVEQKQLSLTN